MKRPLVSLLALAITLAPALLSGTPAKAQNNEKSLAIPHITVSGQGEIKVRPDKMDVTIGVVTEDKSSQAAAASNAQASQRVQAAIRKAGVADKDMRTVNYSVSPVYDTIRPLPTARPQPPKITGYRVYNQVRATVRNLANISDVLDAATAAGSNTIEGLSLGVEDQKTAEGEALEKAVQDARRKADHMVKAAGTGITGILEMTDNTGSSPRMFAFGRAEAGGAAPTPIAAGELTITANVTVTYGLDHGRL